MNGITSTIKLWIACQTLVLLFAAIMLSIPQCRLRQFLMPLIFHAMFRPARSPVSAPSPARYSSLPPVIEGEVLSRRETFTNRLLHHFTGKLSNER